MRYLEGILVPFFLCFKAHAQTASTVQADWLNPSLPDKSTTVTNGQDVILQWTTDLQAWFPQYCSECDTSNVDLWIMGGSIYLKIAGPLS